MARQLTRREWTMIVVLVTVALVVLFLRSEGHLGGGSGTGEAEARPPFEGAPVVRMDLLALNAGEFGDGRRDLFKYHVPGPSQAELDARRKAQEKARQELEERKKRTPPKPVQRRASTPPAPRLPKVPYRYLGFFGPKDDKIATFVEGDEVVIGRVGDVLGPKDEFELMEIDYDSVVIGFTDPKFANKTTTLKMAANARSRR